MCTYMHIVFKKIKLKFEKCEEFKKKLKLFFLIGCVVNC